MVRAEGLVRRYGDFEAVRGISFTIEPGECFGFLGPNGAGKTSTIRMITCRIPVTRGHLAVFGLDARRHPAEIKARMGVVGQENNLDEALSVRENLEIYGAYFGLSRAEAAARARRLLAFVGLVEHAHLQPRQLSGGLKRRLAIARALVNDPDLVVLDEPTTGLDPEARLLVWQRLGELRQRGVTLLLTTHYMEEAARLCDRVALMSEGKLQAVGRPAELVRRYAGEQVLEVDRWEGDLPRVLEQARGQAAGAGGDGLPLQRYRQVGSSYYLYGEDTAPLLQGLAARGVRLLEYRARGASLEDVFLELTGAGLDGAPGGGEPEAEEGSRWP